MPPPRHTPPLKRRTRKSGLAAQFGLPFRSFTLEYAYVVNHWSNAVLTCKMMRSAVVLAAALLAMGLFLGVVAPALGLGVGGSHIALLCVLAATGVMLVAFVLALLPESISHLDQCRH